MCVRTAACPAVYQRCLCARPLTRPGRSHRIHQCAHDRHTSVQAERTHKPLQARKHVEHILQQEHPHVNLCTYTVCKMGHVSSKCRKCCVCQWWALTEGTHRRGAVVNGEVLLVWLARIVHPHTLSYWEMQHCMKKPHQTYTEGGTRGHKKPCDNHPDHPSIVTGQTDFFIIILITHSTRAAQNWNIFATQIKLSSDLNVCGLTVAFRFRNWISKKVKWHCIFFTV